MKLEQRYQAGRDKKLGIKGHQIELKCLPTPIINERQFKVNN